MLRGLLLFLLALSAVHATSVSPQLHECPVCGGKSVAIRLMSYSNFGKPARDLSDHPGFTFSGVDICPSDLYAGFPDTWEDMKPAEKAKLQEFLKSPTLRLTPEEKAIIASHEEEFRESGFFSMLWSRSCDDFLTLSPRSRLHRTLRLHYRGSGISTWKNAKEWEKPLASLYREQAIAALKDARTADWSSPKDKRVFAYLQAELTRQAGRGDEAHALFQQVIAAESALKDSDEETSWILAWAKEQSFRASPDAREPEKLITQILPQLPDPWRDEKAKENPRWPLHHAALDILAQKASSGDKEFSDTLWKLLDRKPERLLALIETSESQVSALRAVESRWSSWFDEIQALLDQNQLPGAFSKDPNPERVRNTLERAVKTAVDDDAPTPWAVHVLLPEVRKYAPAGGIPELEIQAERGPDLPILPDLDSGEIPKPDPVKHRLDQLGRELYDLWQGSPAADRLHIGRVYVRILQRLDDDYESFGYPVMYFLPEMAGTDAGRSAIRAEMDGTWKSNFWKAACAYAAGMENSADALVRHSSMPNVDDQLVAKLFLQKSDPSWKSTAIERLKAKGYLSTSTCEYLASLDLPEINRAMDEFATTIRTGKTGDLLKEWPEGLLYTLRDLDEARIKARLKKIPFR